MARQRKAMVVHWDPHKSESPSLEELNRLLNNGWDIELATAMGGAGASTGAPAESPQMRFEVGYAALVVLEKPDGGAKRAEDVADDLKAFVHSIQLDVQRFVESMRRKAEGKE